MGHYRAKLSSYASDDQIWQGQLDPSHLVINNKKMGEGVIKRGRGSGPPALLNKVIKDIFLIINLNFCIDGFLKNYTFESWKS